jgi:hypothetical protein
MNKCLIPSSICEYPKYGLFPMDIELLMGNLERNLVLWQLYRPMDLTSVAKIFITYSPDG